MKQEDLLYIARTRMPFGKYSGRLLIDLPEAYLLWFEQKGFPENNLGEKLQLSLEIKRHGLEKLLEPLKVKGKTRDPDN